jgi:parvulin-like peptidyl-prolyl isomerase
MFKLINRHSVFAISLTFCASAFAANSVAIIGQKKISPEEFKERYEQNKQLSAPGKSPSKEEVLSNIVNFEVAIQEAKAKGIDRDPMLKDQFEILLYKTLVQKELKPKIDSIKVPESDIQDYYAKNPLLRTRQIVFLVTPEMKPADVEKTKAKAQNVYDLLASGKKKFAELVTEFSEGPDAKYGGMVDWSARNKLVPEYYEAALKLKAPGQFSPVVSTPYGYHIIELEGIKGYAGIDNDYKNFIVRTMREIKGRSLYEAYFSELKKKYAVKTNLDGM